MSHCHECGEHDAHCECFSTEKTVKAKKVSFPRHAYATVHEFRSEKRRQVRNALKALEELRTGCAYHPDSGGFPVPHLIAQLELLKDAMTVKRWGK